VRVEAGNTYWTANPVGMGVLTVAVGSTNQRVTGGGWVADSASVNGKGNFGFTVTRQKNGGPKGSSIYVFRGSDGFSQPSVPTCAILIPSDLEQLLSMLARSALRRTTMVERICPTCEHANPVDDRFCGKCGAQMERQLPARIADARLTIAGRNLPVTWQQLGKTVAISAAALAADVGLAWLRRRLDAGPSATPTTLARSAPAPSEAAAPGRTAGSIVTIISQRVIEVWDSGDGKRQINEKQIWRRIEE